MCIFYGTGPPENVRDHVLAASKALGSGDWALSYQFLAALPVWALVPRREQVLDMLREKLQCEALRTYLFAYGAFYSSLSLDQLCSMFGLSEKKVLPTPS